MVDKGIGVLLSQGDRLLIKRLNRNFEEAGFGITQEQWLVLRQLWGKEGVKQQILANAIGKDKVNVTKLVDSLEDLKLVRRVNDKIDRRAKNIFPTKQGKAMEEKVNAVVDETINEAVGKVSAKDFKAFEKVASVIVKNLSRG